MSETKRETYIRRIENALKNDGTEITHEIIFTEGAAKETLELLKEQPEPTERIYKRGYADGYHKAEKDYFERTQKYRDDAFIAGIETEKEIVRKWLLAYHRMSFDLKGRYLPHEVISWLVNDISKKLFDEGGQE